MSSIQIFQNLYSQAGGNFDTVNPKGKPGWEHSVLTVLEPVKAMVQRQDIGSDNPFESAGQTEGGETILEVGSQWRFRSPTPAMHAGDLDWWVLLPVEDESAF